MRLLLDAGILGRLCHPRKHLNDPVSVRLEEFIAAGVAERRVYIPAVTDYELRRKLLHLIGKGQSTLQSLERLDQLSVRFDYLPVDLETWQEAAHLWSVARSDGFSTSPPEALDCDVILAAQAKLVSGTVVTTNQKHLERFVPTIDWTEIPTTV
ncbi:MAG: type II toxin-antitoxin system VapC family toxin [Planctomycetaceae bacterium]